MKDKWKNLSIALIIAVIVTGILATLIYYTILQPINELHEEMESKSAMSGFVHDSNEQTYQDTLSRMIGFLIVVFCITTVFSYIVIERERLKKPKK